MNISEWLRARALLDPAAPALFHHTTCTADYAGFASRARGLAQRLVTELGVKPGDRVALYMKNSVDYLVCMFGVLWTGAVIVPVNHKLHINELRWILQDSGARFAIVDHCVEELRASDLDCGAIEVSALLNELPESWGPALSKPYPRHPEDLAWLFYTSGTTGRPKGVMLTHANLVAMSLCYTIDVDALHAEEAVIYAAPMSHGAGLYAFIHVRNGSRHVVTASQGFEPAELLATANDLQHASLFAAPTMVKRLVAYAKATKTSADGIKTIICGGAPMYAADLIEALDTLGPRFALIYGQGESPMTITALHHRIVSDRSHPDWPQRIATVGLAHSCVAVRVVDEDMQDTALGTPGEVLVRGSTVMRGYWNNEVASAKSLVDGWLRTGDIGFLDAKGFLTLTDRSKDVIISGGSNIYPREVEEVLIQHPSVFEAAVVGEPHSDWGEQVVAFIRQTPGAELSVHELDSWCKAHIAAFKRPKRYVLVEDLPKSSYGKILKTALRELLKT